MIGRILAARLLFAVLVVALGLVASELRAADSVTIATPIGWSTRDPDDRARERVSTWLARRTDARVKTVLSTGNADDFAEALAVIELDGPYDETRTPELELERALDELIPYDASTVAISSSGERPTIVTAAWTKGSVAYRVALVPAGNHRALVVLAVLADELPLYARAFDEAMAGLAGAATPVRPFDHGRWRAIALVWWLVPAALLLALVLWRRPFGIQYVWIGRGFALTLFAASLVAAKLVHNRMAPRAGELSMAGISPETLTAETVTYGIATGIVCWIIGTVLARRDRPVESAPTSGAFAGRSSSSSSSLAIPIVPKQRERVRHPDGASSLHPATDPPGGRLHAIDLGVEPRDLE
ncbi:MAG TPA: hypothetical protein VG755_24385 [Nannocystaceae bacterium]|nr:hypothetical protein [Nannocystaceae bacterium]